jgi:hypothetical protein
MQAALWALLRKPSQASGALGAHFVEPNSRAPMNSGLRIALMKRRQRKFLGRFSYPAETRGTANNCL